jgi:formylglycine-generating enzyme required for sulfatase activity
MKKASISFFTLLLFAVAATTATAQPKPKLAVFVVGIDDWKRGDVVAHIVGEELNRDKAYQVVTRSGAVQVKLKQLRRTSWYADGCDIRKWGQQHGVEHICLITTPNDRNFSARLYDTNKTEIRRSGGVLGEGMGAVQLKELSWVLTGKLRSSALVADVPCMVYVKGGTFTMGFLPGRDDYADAGGSSGFNTLPAKAGVEVGDFWICEHEVTQAEWLSVRGGFPQNITGTYRGNNKPMIYVSWNDTQNYLATMNEIMVNTGMIFKLPTEAQWEYAARGGVRMFDSCPPLGCAYSGSNDINAVAVNTTIWDKTYPSDVMAKLPNELGIYDMSGNVVEWCEDSWRLSSYEEVPDESCRVCHSGGSGPMHYSRISSRGSLSVAHRSSTVGFRVV